MLLLALVPMWAFVLGEIRHEHALAGAAARKDAMNLATAFEAHVRSTIRLMDIVLLDMREDVLEHPDDFQNHVKEELQAYGSFVSQLGVIDANGQLVFSNLAPIRKPIDLSDREHFRVHRDNPQADRLFISKPVLGRLSHRWSIQFTRPIFDGGKFAGVLALSVPADLFSDYFQQIDVGANGSIVLLGTDRSVRAIASGAPIPGRYGRFKLPEDKPYFVNGERVGYYEGVSSLDGQYHLAAYRRLEEESVLVLVLLSPKDFMAAFEEHRKLLIVSASVISLLLLAVALLIYAFSRRHFRNTARLREAHEQMTQLANTDVLTGVSSRRSFLAGCEAELSRARRHGEDVSLLMLDIDHFKRINDTYGHPIGDEVLAALTATCSRVLRAHDLFGRLGGEEFAIALPSTDLEGALSVAEKIRRAIAEAPISTSAGPITLTVSIGLVSSAAGRDDLQPLLVRADGALYDAKQNGRNRVCAAREGGVAGA